VNIIKLILAILGLIFGVMLFFWLFGVITSLLWYGFWIGLMAAAGYGAYRLFRKAEDKYVGSGTRAGEIGARDFDLSWDEYEKKYLSK
jgi:4-hydroxybenzoate polyprenyltransferase